MAMMKGLCWKMKSMCHKIENNVGRVHAESTEGSSQKGLNDYEFKNIFMMQQEMNYKTMK